MNELNYKMIYTQLGCIIQNLISFKKDDKSLMARVKMAEDYLVTGNVEASSKLLTVVILLDIYINFVYIKKEIIFDTNCSKEDRDIFQSVIELTQSMISSSCTMMNKYY